MIIFHVADIYTRSGGGMPNVIRALALEQIKNGHQVHVLTFQYDLSWPLEEDMEGVHVHRTPLKSGFLPYYFSGFAHMQTLARQVSAHYTPDVLHLHMPFSGLAVCSVLPHIPVVYTFHGSWPQEYAVEASGFKKRLGVSKLELLYMQYLEKKALSKAYAITTLSQFMQKSAQAYSINPTQGWHIIPSGIDLERFKPLTLEERTVFRQQKNIPVDGFVLVSIRRLAHRMGLENLIKAAVLLKKEIPNLFVIIGGKGELKEQLQRQITTVTADEYIRLEGFILEDELSSYFACADVAVLPTVALEGFGLNLLESTASGTPIIGTPVGAIPEVLAQIDDSLLTLDTTPAAIARSVLAFYHSHLNDQAFRQQMRLYAEAYSWSSIANEYEKIYQTCVE